MDLDLRIGAALTRIQTMKLQQAFPGVLENVISYGKGIPLVETVPHFTVRSDTLLGLQVPASFRR